MQSFAQACSFNIATLKWFTPVTVPPGLGPELCHDRGLALPRPWDCVGVTVTLGVSSVKVSGLASDSESESRLAGVQAYESTPFKLAVIAVNRHQSSISSLESLSTSKYPQLIVRPRTAQWAIRSRVRRGGRHRDWHPPLLCGDSVSGTASASESRGWRWARGLLGPGS